MSLSYGSRWLIGVSSLIGLAAFLSPFVIAATPAVDERSARSAEAPLLLALVTAGSLAAIAIEAGRGVAGNASKTVALLGVLVAIDASLRLAPSFLGATPIFLLIMLTGAVFGSAFGFQMGALTLLVSAFLTGGIGPWLPFQMLAAGWVGMTAGWLPRPSSMPVRVGILAVFGVVWGFLFGLLMNLWFWPVTAPGAGVESGLAWAPGLSLAETIDRYARFYLITSAWHDAFRAIGNGVLVLVLAAPLLHLLERFHRRFSWEPWVETP